MVTVAKLRLDEVTLIETGAFRGMPARLKMESHDMSGL
jgi:hypothetical protein